MSIPQNGLWKYFTCQRCGKCCCQIGLPYDSQSWFNIADFLNISVKQVIEKYYGTLSLDGSEWVSDDSKRIPCPFLKTIDGHLSCEIYSIRPDGCKLYPIDTDFGRNGIDCPAWKIAFTKLKMEQKRKYR